MAHTRYIGIKKPDAAGSFEAWLFLPQGVPATQPPRNIRRIRSGPSWTTFSGNGKWTRYAEMVLSG